MATRKPNRTLGSRARQSSVVICTLLCLRALAAFAQMNQMDSPTTQKPGVVRTPQTSPAPLRRSDDSDRIRKHPVSLQFDERHRLLRPTGFEEWIFVGAAVTPRSENPDRNAHEGFRSIYLDPYGWSVFRQTGHIPDGAVFVRQWVSIGARSASSGRGYFMGETGRLEVSARSAEHFPDTPGNWGFFGFGERDAGKAEIAAVSLCLGCHTTASSQEMVFIEHYPLLREARERVLREQAATSN